MAISSLSETLKSQNDQLVDISKGIGSINTSFTKWFDVQDRQRLQDLETERDDKASTEAVKTAVVNGSTSSKKSSGSTSGGMFGGGMKGLGASLGIGGIFAKGGFMKTAGIFGLSQLMAGSIGNMISNLTGDPELAAAAANIAKFAGVGALFGKKFALLGAVAGALATPENKQALSDIGDSLGERGKQVKDALLDMGIQLPKLSEVYTGIGDVTNSLLLAIKAIVDTDLTALQKESLGLNTAAGAALGISANKGLRGLGKGGQVPKVPQLGEGVRQGINFESAKKLSKAKIEKLKAMGVHIGANGLRGQRVGSTILASVGDKALASVGAPTSTQARGLAAAMAKYKNFSKLAKLPYIGSLLGIGNMGMILSNDSLTAEEKKAQMASSLAELGGATLGGIAGSMMLGGPTNPGGIAMGIAGSIAGAFAGPWLAGQLADLIMGDDKTELMTMANQLIKEQNAVGNAGQNISKLSSAMSGFGMSSTPNNASRTVPLDGAKLKDAGATSASLNLSGGGGAAIFAPVQTSNNSSSSNTSIVGSRLSTTDFNDLAGTRTA
jgi:hypothetical protein